MKINLKKIKDKMVFEKGESMPCGKIRGICFSGSSGKVDSLQVESLSIIPLAKNFRVEEFEQISENFICLKEGIRFSEHKNSLRDAVLDRDVSTVIMPDGKRGILRDVAFDFETGRIAEFFVKNGRLKKPNEIFINKIKIKDNTIYIETKGGD